MIQAGLKKRWVMVAAGVVMAAMATACNATDSMSASASTDDWSDDDGSDVSVGEDDNMFGTLDLDDKETHGCGKVSGCPEVALWCPSTGTALSPDPDNCCRYPKCPK